MWLVCALLVGGLWGSTNTFVKRGTDTARRRQEALKCSSLWALLTTPSFLIPQAANQSGSALFIYLLGAADISLVVPVANATALVITALTELALGHHYKQGLLAAGVLLVSIGVLLCGLT